MPSRCAFALVFNSDAHVLLCRRKKDGKWNLPGGEANAREPPWEAAIREVREELNVEVQIERLCGVYHVIDKDDLVMTFACTVASGEPKPSDEIEEVGWFDPMHLPENMRERHAERVTDERENGDVVIRSES